MILLLGKFIHIIKTFGFIYKTVNMKVIGNNMISVGAEMIVSLQGYVLQRWKLYKLLNVILIQQYGRFKNVLKLLLLYFYASIYVKINIGVVRTL